MVRALVEIKFIAYPQLLEPTFQETIIMYRKAIELILERPDTRAYFWVPMRLLEGLTITSPERFLEKVEFFVYLLMDQQIETPTTSRTFTYI